MDDDVMRSTVESVREFGVLVPAIARPCDGGYELISSVKTRDRIAHALLAELNTQYDEIITWSEIYGTAGFEAKKMIVNCLISRVEVHLL